MKRIVILCFTLSMISCKDKEILLPKADKTILSKVENLSPVYFFFKIEKNDTIVQVNRNNTISSTNWVFNIDKRLPLRMVIPEIKKLLAKKKMSAHSNQTTQNYLTYTDTVHKSLAFFPFSSLKIKNEVPEVWMHEIRFDKNNVVRVKDFVFATNQLPNFLVNSMPDKRNMYFSFNKNMSYGEYLKFQIMILDMQQKGLCKTCETIFVY